MVFPGDDEGFLQAQIEVLLHRVPLRTARFEEERDPAARPVNFGPVLGRPGAARNGREVGVEADIEGQNIGPLDLDLVGRVGAHGPVGVDPHVRIGAIAEIAPADVGIGAAVVDRAPGLGIDIGHHELPAVGEPFVEEDFQAGILPVGVEREAQAVGVQVGQILQVGDDPVGRGAGRQGVKRVGLRVVRSRGGDGHTLKSGQGVIGGDEIVEVAVDVGDRE